MTFSVSAEEGKVENKKRVIVHIITSMSTNKKKLDPQKASKWRASKLPAGWQPVSENYDDISDHKLWKGDLHEEKNNEVYIMIQKMKEEKEQDRLAAMRAYGKEEGESPADQNTNTAASFTDSISSWGSSVTKKSQSMNGDILSTFYRRQRRKRIKGSAGSRSNASADENSGARRPQSTGGMPESSRGSSPHIAVKSVKRAVLKPSGLVRAEATQQLRPQTSDVSTGSSKLKFSLSERRMTASPISRDRSLGTKAISASSLLYPRHVHNVTHQDRAAKNTRGIEQLLVQDDEFGSFMGKDEKTPPPALFHKKASGLSSFASQFKTSTLSPRSQEQKTSKMTSAVIPITSYSSADYPDSGIFPPTSALSSGLRGNVYHSLNLPQPRELRPLKDQREVDREKRTAVAVEILLEKEKTPFHPIYEAPKTRRAESAQLLNIKRQFATVLNLEKDVLAQNEKLQSERKRPQGGESSRTPEKSFGETFGTFVDSPMQKTTIDTSQILSSADGSFTSGFLTKPASPLVAKLRALRTAKWESEHNISSRIEDQLGKTYEKKPATSPRCTNVSQSIMQRRAESSSLIPKDGRPPLPLARIPSMFSSCLVEEKKSKDDGHLSDGGNSTSSSDGSCRTTDSKKSKEAAKTTFVVEPTDLEGIWNFEVDQMFRVGRRTARGGESQSESPVTPSTPSKGGGGSKTIGLFAIQPRSSSRRETLVPSRATSPPEHMEWKSSPQTFSLSSPSFSTSKPTFDPRIRLLDGTFPSGTVDFGSAALREKIYALEKLAPVEYPRIVTEWWGDPEFKYRRPTSAHKHGKLVKPDSRPTSASTLGRRRSQLSSFVHHSFTMEESTYFPPQELHIYQLFCINAKYTLIFRPVSPALPSMYAGEFLLPPKYCDENGIPYTIDEIQEHINPDITWNELQKLTTSNRRVRGKGIKVSLKSSPYNPIFGYIPVNPGLSKTYTAAAKKTKKLEDMLLSLGGDGGKALSRKRSTSITVMKKLRAQQATFGSASYVAVQEIEQQIQASDKKLEQVWKEYSEASMMSHNKLEVAQQYIDDLNDFQYLGKTTARWHGLDLYYRQPPYSDDVARSKNGDPTFFARRDKNLYIYKSDENELDLTKPLPPTQDYFPVEILTHRSFVISPASNRIVPDPEGDFLIGPDFDGLSYAQQIKPKTTPGEYKQWCLDQVDLHLVPSMGLVNKYDIEHVLDIRKMTEWKQNHGYECNNTVKTQELDPGEYVVVTPTEVRVLDNFTSVIAYYSNAWTNGYPLLLNPNWKTVIDPEDMLPVPFGEELTLPIIDDCGMGAVKEKINKEGLLDKFDDMKIEAREFELKMKDYTLKYGVTDRRRILFPMSSSIIPELSVTMAKKQLAEKFFSIRRWMLMPPLFKVERDVFLGGIGGATKFDMEFEAFRMEKINEGLQPLQDELTEFNLAFPEDKGNFTEKLMAFLTLDRAAAAVGTRKKDSNDISLSVSKSGVALHVDHLGIEAEDKPDYEGFAGNSNPNAEPRFMETKFCS